MSYLVRQPVQQGGITIGSSLNEKLKDLDKENHLKLETVLREHDRVTRLALKYSAFQHLVKIWRH